MSVGTRIIKVVLSHPTTWIALGVVAALVWGFHAWFQPPLPMSAAAAAMGLVCLAAWPVALVRSRAFAAQLLQAPKALVAEQQDRLIALAQDFESLGFDQGTVQLERLPEK